MYILVLILWKVFKNSHMGYIFALLLTQAYIYFFIFFFFPFIYLFFSDRFSLCPGTLYIFWLSWNLLCRSSWLQNHRDPLAFVWAWINIAHHHTCLIVFINENICSIMRISTCEIFVVGLLNMYTLSSCTCSWKI